MTDDTTDEFVCLDDYTDAIDDPAVDVIVSRMGTTSLVSPSSPSNVAGNKGLAEAGLAGE